MMLVAMLLTAAPAHAQEPPPLRGISLDEETLRNPRRVRTVAVTPTAADRARAKAPLRPERFGAAATRAVDPAPLRLKGTLALTPPPEPRRPRRAVDDDPFAPVGFLLGSFVVRPALDLEAGYDTNPNRVHAPVKPSSLFKPSAEIRANSEWARHSAEFTLRGAYSYYPALESANRPNLDGRGVLRLDVTKDTIVDAEGRIHLDTQTPQSTNLPFPTSERPLVFTGGGTLGGTQRFNRFTVGLRGAVDRTVYQDATLPDGTVVSQGSRDMTAYLGALRLGYEANPGLRPFFEMRLDNRHYDDAVDAGGYARSSHGWSPRLGSTFEFTRTLTGEISVGYESRNYDDPRLSNLNGLVGNAALIWSLSPLTTVGLRAAQTLDETTVAGVNGVVTRNATLQIDHAFRRWLTGTVIASVSQSDYRGAIPSETTYTATLRFDYKLTRSLALRASFTHERLATQQIGRDYTANVFLVGLRLQR